MELVELTKEVVELGKDMAVVKTNVAFLMKSYWLLMGTVLANLSMGVAHFRLYKKNGKK